MDDKENTTKGGNRSFEERVFARFDALDARLNNMDERLQKLEARSYDTKPIWERALVEITETRREMQDHFQDFDVRLDRVESVVNATRSEMLTLRADFKEFRAHVKEPA